MNMGLMIKLRTQKDILKRKKESNGEAKLVEIIKQEHLLKNRHLDIKKNVKIFW